MHSIMIPSWLAIGAITFLVAAPLSRLSSRDQRWFNSLRRPRWLTFERLIPVIWISIFICGAASAYFSWQKQPGTAPTWRLMGLYIALEIVTLAYTPVMCKLHSLKAGTLLGAAGFILGLLLFSLAIQHSTWAAGLLVPFLLWSPIGTYVTWDMMRLNPAEQ
jgi:translocator protein